MKGALAVDAVRSMIGSQGDSMMMMDMRSSAVQSVNLFFSDVNDIVSESIKQLFRVQNEALFYEARMVGNAIGMVRSASQAAAGLVAAFKGAKGVVGGKLMTTSGILAPAGAAVLVAGGAISVAGLAVASRGAIATYTLANIFGDNLQRRDELRRAANCDGDPGSPGQEQENDSNTPEESERDGDAPIPTPEPERSLADMVDDIKSERIKLHDLPLDDQLKVANEIKASSPIEIPNDVEPIIKHSDSGYDQISFKWSDETHTYEVRWHTATPEAPEGTPPNWRVDRKIPGFAGGKDPETGATIQGYPAVREVLISPPDATPFYIPRSEWKDATTAYANGTATDAQKELLKFGHIITN